MITKERIIEIFIKFLVSFSCLFVFIINYETARGNSPKVSLTTQEQAWLADHPEIRLGFNPHMEPLLIKSKDGSYDGIYPTLIGELEQVLGVSLKIEVDDWNPIVQKARKREIDGLLACAPSQAEASNLLSTHPIHQSYPVAFTRYDSPIIINSLDDLEGKSIAYQREVKMLEVALDQLKDGNKIVAVKSTLEAISLVLEGKVDVAVGINFENYLVAKHALSGIKLSYIDLKHASPISTCIRNDWPEFIEIFNKGLTYIGKSMIQEILFEWTSTKEGSPKLELTSEEKAWLTGDHVVQVRITNFPPYIMPNQGGTPRGIAVDYLKLIAERTGVEFNYHSSGKTFGQALEGLKEHQGPDLISTMMPTPERQKHMLFSEEFFKSPYVIFIHVDDKSFVTGMNDLADKNIAIVNGTILNEMILRDYPDSNLVYFKNDIQAIDAVANGKADAYIGNLILASYHILDKGLYNIKLAAPSLFGEHVFSMGIRSDWPQLASIIDKGLASITEEEQATIRSRYVHIQYNQSNTTEIIKWILVVAGIGSGIICLFIFWNRSLKRKVILQTKDLSEEINERIQADEKLKKTTYDLGKRLKELNCLYRISELVDSENTTTKEIFQGTADIIPPSWQYPEITCAKIKIGDQSYKSDNFKETEWLQSQKIIASGITVGEVKVFYCEEKPEIDEGPFFKEERNLINVIAERLGNIIEKKEAKDVKGKLEFQLQQAQKMEAIGTLAGGIAHDFNNILGAIIGYTEMARDDSPDGSSVANDLDKVLDASGRAADLVKQILAFSRQDEAEHILLQPATIVNKALTMLRPTLPTTIEITKDIDTETGLVFADPTRIHQIMMNLCTNAFHAMEETGGRLDISLKELDLCKEDITHEYHTDPGTFIKLSIRDTGPGMSQEVKDKIFDPYFTTKGVGKGTGMGLSIVHGIIKSYGGFITLSSELGKGAVFHIFLPVTDKEVISDKEAIRQIPAGKERILFIDDEEILVEMGKDMLERLGYHVTVSKSSLEALETFKNQPDQFDIVVTDQTMPGMTGVDLARRLLQIRSDIPIILCTGYSSIISEEKAKSMGVKEFALKPLTKKDIAVLIRKVLDEN